MSRYCNACIFAQQEVAPSLRAFCCFISVSSVKKPKRSRIMPIELPDDLDGFHALLKTRIRVQEAIDDRHDESSGGHRVDAKQKIAGTQVLATLFLRPRSIDHPS